MSIAFSKYIRIISGVGGGNTVRQRDLIGRIITSSVLLSPDTVLEFRSAADVGNYFGTASLEYRRAVEYFAYISPTISGPRLLSFSRWAENGSTATVIGSNDPKTLASVQLITTGAFSLQIGTAAPVSVSGVNLSGASTMAAAATALQTAIRAANPSLTTATVTYGTDGPQRFTITLPAALQTLKAASTVSGVQDIATVLGLSAASNGISIAGVGPQLVLDAFNVSADISDNFGSFLFVDEIDLPETVSVAAANAALNLKFIFTESVVQANAAAWAAALGSYAGLALTLAAVNDTEFPEQLPMAILAATDYTKRNAVQNYMFRQSSGLTPRVLATALSDTLDALRVNYYGQTATAGQKIAFYQRGTLMGTGTAPTDMNVYANEMWLKDYAASLLMTLELSVGRVPANDTGIAMVYNTVQEAVDRALTNGVISVGKTLTAAQKVYIGQRTGDDLAWHTVEDVGYVLNVTIQPFTTASGATEYKAVYDLIYSKDDAIRVVEGTHSLI